MRFAVIDHTTNERTYHVVEVPNMDVLHQELVVKYGIPPGQSIEKMDLALIALDRLITTLAEKEWKENPIT